MNSGENHVFNFVAPALALTATVLGLAAQAGTSAGTDVRHARAPQAEVAVEGQQTASADLNGDGRLDRVVLQPVAGNESRQLLITRIGGKRLTATVPMNNHGGVQPMRVVDVNADGRDEVVVTQSVGANTDSFGVWGLHGGALSPVRLVDGTQLILWQGGGASAMLRYGCTADHDGRQLVQASGMGIGDYTVFEGERIVYTVDGGVATEVSREPVRGPRDTPGFQADPAACA
jgi:hypothetical protein